MGAMEENPSLGTKFEDMMISEPLCVEIARGRGLHRHVAYLGTGPFPVGTVYSVTRKGLMKKIVKATDTYYRALRFF